MNKKVEDLKAQKAELEAQLKKIEADEREAAEEKARKAVEVILAIYASAKEGKLVRLS